MEEVKRSGKLLHRRRWLCGLIKLAAAAHNPRRRRCGRRFRPETAREANTSNCDFVCFRKLPSGTSQPVSASSKLSHASSVASSKPQTGSRVTSSSAFLAFSAFSAFSASVTHNPRPTHGRNRTWRQGRDGSSVPLSNNILYLNHPPRKGYMDKTSLLEILFGKPFLEKSHVLRPRLALPEIRLPNETSQILNPQPN